MNIGIFDSGIGGLTVVRELFNIVSGCKIIYFADVGHMPYGNKKCEDIIKYTEKIVKFLKSKDVDIIVSACGTVSSLIPSMKENNIIGVIEPSCISASKSSKNKKIGVIATSLAVKIGEYRRFLNSLDQKFEIFLSSCPNLASIIENSPENQENISNYIELCISPIAEKNIDTLILGCTHYPLVKKVIEDKFPSLNIIDSSLETAKFIRSIINQKKTENLDKNRLLIYVSELRKKFIENASHIMNFDCSNIIKYQRID